MPAPIDFDGFRVWVKIESLPEGTWGTIVTSGTFSASVRLFRDTMLPEVPWKAIELCDDSAFEEAAEAATAEESTNVYAPFAGRPVTKARDQTLRFAQALDAAKAQASMVEAWPRLF